MGRPGVRTERQQVELLAASALLVGGGAPGERVEGGLEGPAQRGLAGSPSGPPAHTRKLEGGVTRGGSQAACHNPPAGTTSLPAETDL